MVEDGKSPTLSIVIPVFNRVSLIVETINSVMNQDFDRAQVELVIIDNQSNDGTYELLCKIKNSFPCIKLYRNTENIGPVGNWINGLSFASGKYCKLLFSDDLMLNGSIMEIIDHIHQKKFDALLSNVLIGKNIQTANYGYSFNATEDLRYEDYEKRLLLNRLPISPCAYVFRRDVFLESMRTPVSEYAICDFNKYGSGVDVLSCLRTVESTRKILIVNKAYVFFRQHSDSLTCSSFSNEVQSHFFVALLHYFMERGKFSHVSLVLARSFVFKALSTKLIS
ncbi:MAG TPA: glycosyltransferase family 2 protein, partial [Emticicia sp.]